ncbi:MAG: pilus assembly protein N-terminal domain-containing protein [Myxococcaceae bacterium]
MSPLALAAVLSAIVAAAPDATVRVSPGTQEVLKVAGVTRVAVGDSDVVDVRVTGANELLLSGKKRGRTSLTLWARGQVLYRTVVVDDGGSTEIARLVKETVNPTLKVGVFNEKVVIDGMVDSMDELRRLHTLVGQDPNVKLLVTMNPRVLPFVAEQITQALARSGLPNARAVAVGGRIILEGSVTEASEREKAQTIADAYYSGFHGAGI